MKIKIKNSELKKLGSLESIISEKSPQEILSHILFESSDNIAAAFVTNLETALQIKLQCEIIESGDFSIIGNKIFGISRNLKSDDNIIITALPETAKIKIQSGNFKTETQGFRKDDFPALATFKSEKEFNIKIDMLKYMIENVSFASQRENTNKQYLNGVYFNFSNQDIKAVGSDGFRLAEITEQQNNDIECSFILPNKTVIELAKINFNSEIVKVSLDYKNIRFESDSVVYISRIIDEKFPNYEQVIPKDYPHILNLKVSDLISGLNLVKISADKMEKVLFNFSENKIEMTTSGTEAESIYEIETESSFNIRIPFKISYLLEFLKTVKTETVELQVKDSKSQCMFKTADVLYITMPMRF